MYEVADTARIIGPDGFHVVEVPLIDVLLERTEWDGECLLFVGIRRSTSDHYQLLRIVQPDGTRATRQAHRLMYELHNGPVPPRLVIRHTCDRPRCVNPGHLITGTHADNGADRSARNRVWRKGMRGGKAGSLTGPRVRQGNQPGG